MKIICEDTGGNQLILGWFPPLWLRSVEGLGADYNVYTAKFGTQDGEYYAGSSAKMRNIVLVLDVNKANEPEQRQQLLAFFPPRSEGTFYYFADDDSPGRKISYYAEKVEPSGDGALRHFTISLICPNPLFSDLQATQIPMSYWKKLLQFPFPYRPPFKVAERIAEKIVTVYNNTNVAAGLLIYFTARGSVANPGMTEVRTQKRFQLNTQMLNGDIILVNTNQNEKGASFQEDPEYVDMWHFGDTWLQLQPGENVFQYFADSGADFLDVKIIYMPRYWGA